MAAKSEVQYDIEVAALRLDAGDTEDSIAFSLLAIAKMLYGVIGNHGTVIDVRAEVRRDGI